MKTQTSVYDLYLGNHDGAANSLRSAETGRIQTGRSTYRSFEDEMEMDGRKRCRIAG